MGLTSNLGDYANQSSPQYGSGGAPAIGSATSPGTAATTSGSVRTPTSVGDIVLEASMLVQARNGGALTVGDMGQIQKDAWTLMPTLTQPNQTLLMQFLTELSQENVVRAGTNIASGILLTEPPKQNPFTNGPNIQLIMMVLYGEMTKMANEGTIDMSKLQAAQMEAKLQAAIQTATLQVSSSEAQAQQLEADAATARAAAFAAMTQFVVGVVVTSVQVGMNLGARTATDERAGYAKTDRPEFNADGSRNQVNTDANLAGKTMNANAKNDAFGNAKTGEQNAQQYAAYTRSRSEDLLVYNKTLDFLTSAGQTLSTFASKQAEAENDIKKADLTRLKGQVDAAISMLQSLQETMSKSIDVVSSAKEAYKDMLQSMKQMVESVFQLATKMANRA